MVQLSDSRSKRDEIIEVATKLFYEQGYNQTGIQQIIGEANVAKGTFYSHFKSKEALGVAWLKKQHATWNTGLQQVLQQTSVANKQIILMFDYLSAWMQKSDFRGCAFLNTLAETPECTNPLRLEIAEHKKGLLEQFQSLVNKQHPALKKGESEHIASTLFVLFEGALIATQNFRELWPIEVAKTQVKRLLKK